MNKSNIKIAIKILKFKFKIINKTFKKLYKSLKNNKFMNQIIKSRQ
jgi:hypothetical protein